MKTSKNQHLLVLLLTFCVSFVASEIGLRMAGFEAGRIYYAPWFHPVDSLVMMRYSFVADSFGITKFSDEAAGFVREQIAAENADENTHSHVFSEVKSISENFKEVRAKEAQNAFQVFYTNSINNKVVSDYVSSPINENGFKSIAFKNADSAKQKILIIGDSHAFGHSCTNITSGFADVLLTRGYTVFNTGLSGSDPAQYEAIARKYIPELKPHYVLANLFLENDVVYHHRELKPLQPFFWVTNAGHLFSCPEGVYFNSPYEAYRNMLRHYYIPQTNAVNVLFSSSVVTTFFWRALQKYFSLVNNSTPELADYDQRVAALKTKEPYTNSHVKNIMDLSATHGAKFFVFTIPQRTKFGLKRAKDFKHFLVGVPFHEFNFSLSDYAETGGHLNERGHNKFAAFVVETIAH